MNKPKRSNLNEKRAKCLVLTAIILTLIISIMAQAGERTTYNVSVSVALENSDTTLARHDAVNEAMRKAIMEAITSLVTPQILAEKLAQIEAKLLSKPGGYLISFEIKSERLDSQTVPSLTIDASVGLNQEDILKDLIAMGIPMQKKGYPKLMVLIKQSNIDDYFRHNQTGNLNLSELKMTEVLSSAGFPFIDQPSFFKALGNEGEDAFYSSNIDTIAEYSQRWDAQVVIIGEAVSERAKTRLGVDNANMAEAVVQLKAIIPKTGTIIASSFSRASQSHADILAAGKLAIEKAISEAAQTLGQELIINWMKEQSKGYKITMVVNGLKTIEDLLEFKNEFAASFRDVLSIERRSFADNTAAFDLVATVPGEEIADQLQTTSLPSYNLVVRSRSTGYLELNVRPR